MDMLRIMRCLWAPDAFTLALAIRIASTHIASPLGSTTLRCPMNFPLKSMPAPWKRKGSLGEELAKIIQPCVCVICSRRWPFGLRPAFVPLLLVEDLFRMASLDLGDPFSAPSVLTAPPFEFP